MDITIEYLPWKAYTLLILIALSKLKCFSFDVFFQFINSNNLIYKRDLFSLSLRDAIGCLIKYVNAVRFLLLGSMH